jgi:type IV pilus assembly protein PilA
MTQSLAVRNPNRIARRSRKGFTLIELIVVIAILAILAAIAIPAFTGQLNRAKNNSHNANVAVLKSAAQIALAENGNPTSDVNWTGLATGTGNSGAFLASKYIDTWPANPISGGAAYSVSITTAGVVAVTPVAVSTT